MISYSNYIREPCKELSDGLSFLADDRPELIFIMVSYVCIRHAGDRQSYVIPSTYP